MFERIQPFLRGINRGQVVAGVAGFLSGVGLTLYLEHRSEIVVFVDDDGDIIPLDAESPIDTEEEPVVVTSHNPVISPVENDPRMIMVDLQALARREELISEHGFEKGMELYEAEYSQGTIIPQEEPEEESVVNIFASEDTEWNQEAEEASRQNATEPYVISKDEFYSDELGYTQTTLTYYQGDDILVDQEDIPVYNYTATIGELKFGHGSQDANVFFVRNDKNKAEYEIIRDRGHYSVEVLGLEAEAQTERAQLKHSLRKFRQDD